MKKFILCFLCACFCLSLVGCKKADNLEKLSANLTSYSINIDLNAATHSATCTECVMFVNNCNAILKNVKFHLYPQFFEQAGAGKVVASTHMNEAYPHGMSYAEFEVTRVAVAGKDQPVVYSGECDGILSVDLNSSLMPNENVEIYIEFNFTLPNCEHRIGYGDNTINLGNFYPIACVYENGAFDECGYSPNGDPFYSDMANYSVNIATDSGYTVAGSGRKTQDAIENGKKVCKFTALMVRDFALVLSNKFEVVSGMADKIAVDYYYFNEDEATAKANLQAGIDAIKTYSKLFGDYPYENFSIAKADFVYGGMEYPNLVLINADIDNADDYKNVIVHETAHQWWYGVVGSNEHEFPWLDEGLTEYSTLLFYDNNSGYNLTHAEMLKANKENYTLFISVYEDVLGNIDTSMRSIYSYSTEPEYTYCTYVKGVLMFESLNQLIGEKKFTSALKEYYSANKYTNAQPKDLIAAFEKTSKMSLTNFFNSWLQGKVVVR